MCPSGASTVGSCRWSDELSSLQVLWILYNNTCHVTNDSHHYVRNNACVTVRNERGSGRGGGGGVSGQ